MTPPDGGITLVGHAFAPSGRGEDVRCSFRALAAAGVSSRVLDIYGLSVHDPDHEAEMGAAVTRELGTGVNLFHINGDEIDQALRHLGAEDLPKGRNVIYPNWELSRYPADWAEQLERFDEIWAPSRFVLDGLRQATATPVYHMPLATEVRLRSFLGRRAFGIPEGSYVFLFFFDFTSFIARKNPFAAVEAFAQLVKARPHDNVTFVIKLNNSRQRTRDFEEFQRRIEPFRNRILIIDRALSDNEMKNLVRLSDCFISLHRSEGYGRGLAEAMFLGKPVIATGYSGNMDFTTPETALLVDYTLVPVEDGSYPRSGGQVWADADTAKAAAHMVRLLDDPGFGRALGRKAGLHMRRSFAYPAIGLRYRDRIEAMETSC